MYNLLLESYNKLHVDYKEGKISQSEYKSSMTSLNPSFYKKEVEFLKEVDSTALKYSHKNVNQAFNNAFAGRANFPNFKSKSKSKWSYTTRSEEHTSELQSRFDLVCRLLLEKKRYNTY